MEGSNYESFKQKIQKLSQLAEKGEDGEAKNARKAMERLCDSMGVKLEDVLDEVQSEKKYVFSVTSDKLVKDLFFICAENCGISWNSIGAIDRFHYAAWITPLQYAELYSLWEWHKANFRKELKKIRENLLIAYLYKHNLCIKIDNEEKGDEGDDEELLEHAQKSLELLKLLDDTTYVKDVDK